MSEDQPTLSPNKDQETISGPSSPLAHRSPTTVKHSLTSPQPSPKSTLKHPQGPRAQTLDSTTTALNDSDPRNRAGSSRTRMVTLPPTVDAPAPTFPAINRSPTSPTRAKTTPLPTTTNATTEPESNLPPYRSPEPVFDPPEEHPEGFVPGVVEEHMGDYDSPGGNWESPKARNPDINVSRWQADIQPGYDDAGMDQTLEPERPQLGHGMTARRVVDLIHEHPLVRLNDFTIPPRKSHGAQPSVTKVPEATKWGNTSNPNERQPAINPLSPSSTGTGPSSATPTGTLDFDHIRTEDDVKASLPGGPKRGQEGRDEWYFCWECCNWYNIRTATDNLDLRDGKIEFWYHSTQDRRGQDVEWDIMPDPTQNDARFDPLRGQAYLRDIEVGRNEAKPGDNRIHYHELRSSPTEPSARTLERIEAGKDHNMFPHAIPGMEIDAKWFKRSEPEKSSRLFLSCGTKDYFYAEAGPVAGQLPSALVKAFIQEKQANPNVGASPTESVIQALQLLMTLLAGPLFKGQRGWVKLENPKFQAKIGSTILSSLMLYMIGFGCKEEKEGLTVGPFSLSGEVTEEQLLQQDQYMMRTWIELGMILQGWLDKQDVNNPVAGIPVTVTRLDGLLDEGKLQRRIPLPTIDMAALQTLGMSVYDSAKVVPTTYEWQVGCDSKNIPAYLGAVERLSKDRLQGADDLQYLVATQRSLGRFTDTELQSAYEKIGYTDEYAMNIYVDAHEAPDEEILRMHRVAVQSVSNPADKAEMAQALEIIGKHRKNHTMRRLGGSGQSLMSVEEAYAALSAPADSIDDGLIMQYEMAVNEYPGKVEHYRSCLEIIAKAGGEERQGLRRYLETGSNEPEVIKRNDIPAGLHNIGNTCYLNSILQYLYSIKPLREAVLSFDQGTGPMKPEVERSKRFVHQLRLLFLQLYKTDAPAVRPDEELAYLAITRPEVDQIVEPDPPVSSSMIDDLPTVGSPSSTCVNTPSNSRPSSPLRRSVSASRSSILGKRISQDRDTSESPGDRPKKSDGFERLREETPPSDPFEMVERPDDVQATPVQRESTPPSSATDASSVPSSAIGPDIEGLRLKSPAIESSNPMETYAPPPGPPPLPPRPRRASKGTLNAGLKFGLQQDSAEVLINVLSQLETAFEPPRKPDGSKGHNIIADLFSCEYRQQLIYKTAEGTLDAQTPVNSVFVHPIIGVEEEGKDLYDCLAELYLGGADIEYEGKKGHMMDLMDKFPPMLYIQMRRSQYDLATGRERKTNTHIPFDQTLDMDRFLADADPQKREKSIELTRKMMTMRSRLHELRNQKPLSVPASFDHLHNSLKSLQADHADLDITDQFLTVLQADKAEVEREIDTIQTSIPGLKAELETLWAGQCAYAYELVSVFMHRGKTSGAGHYWTYQSHLPDHRERFFKYNDELVTEVPADEVLQDRTGSDANPALLCYVRKGKDLVDTLHREVYEFEQADNSKKEAKGTSDVVMASPSSTSGVDIEMNPDLSKVTPVEEQKDLISFDDLSDEPPPGNFEWKDRMALDD